MRNGFCKRPVLLKYWLLRFIFSTRKPHAKEYHKRTTLRSESSTIKGLFYTPDPENARKGRWVISPNYPAWHPWRFCAIGDVVAQRYDVPHDWLWDACHMPGVHWKSHCKGFCSKEGSNYCFEQSARKLSEDKQQSKLIHKFENSLWIPYLSCNA